MTSEASFYLLPDLTDEEKLLRPIGNAHSDTAEFRSEEASLSSDEALLEAIGTGDRNALGVLFQRHARSVLHVAWRILRDEAEARDLRQDVFVYIFERSQLFDPDKGSAVSWIMQIVYHRAFNRRKFLARRAADSLDIIEQQVHSSTAPPSTDLIDGKAMLQRMKKELTLPQQKTIEMHLFEGYSLREIAEETDQTVVNVRHHYYRAIERLRQNLFSKKPGMSERIGNRPHRKGN